MTGALELLGLLSPLRSLLIIPLLSLLVSRSERFPRRLLADFERVLEGSCLAGDRPLAPDLAAARDLLLVTVRLLLTDTLLSRLASDDIKALFVGF